MNFLEKYLKVLRVKDWLSHLFLKSMLGAVLAGGTILQTLHVGLIYFCVLGYGFLINDYYDIDIDRNHTGKVKRKQNTLASKIISKRKSLLILAVLLISSVLLSIPFNQTGIFFVVLCLASLTLYSIPKIRLKERIALDIITHGIMFSSCFLGGYFLISSAISKGALLVFLVIYLWSQVSLIVHQMKDYEEDKKTSKNTVLNIGLEKSWRLLQAHLILLAAINEIFILAFGLSPLLHTLGAVYLIYAFKCNTLPDFSNVKSRNATIDKVYLRAGGISIIGTAILISL